MTVSLDDLAAILEQELAVAQALENNLAAQKQAIVDWNAAELLAAIDSREPWLRRLDELEQARSRCLAQQDNPNKNISLRGLLAREPKSASAVPRLRLLQQQTKQIFTRLDAEERRFNALLKNLSNLIDEAWSPLLQAAPPTYGENGAEQRPAGNFLHSRA
jgi:flagellar biosynthesis/type III secretory pathway chaperone